MGLGEVKGRRASSPRRFPKEGRGQQVQEAILLAPFPAARQSLQSWSSSPRSTSEPPSEGPQKATPTDGTDKGGGGGSAIEESPWQDN